MRPAPPIYLAIALVCCASSARGDIVELESGGRVVGKVVESSDPEARSQVTVDLKEGGRIVFDRSQVARVTPQSPAAEEYARRAPTAPDTVESQWALARWCQEHKLADEYRRHLQRVAELDPDHEEARRQLGLQRVGGEWMTRDDVMASRGMVQHEGKWRTRQEIELIQRSELTDQRVTDHRIQLRTWRRWLDNGSQEHVAEALAGIENLNDAAAGEPVAELLAGESDPRVKRLLVEAAARIPHSASGQVLAKLALEDPDSEVRFVCLEYLARMRSSGLIALFAGALRDRDNVKVNRAAVGLRVLEARGAVGPLVEALATKHRHQVGNASGGDTYSVSPTAGGLSVGGNGPKVVTELLRNPEVLRTLIELTGVNFNYDQRAWKAWMASQIEVAQVDIRRDQ